MASLFNSKHNKYVSIPDWFKDTDLSIKPATESKTVYVGGGGGASSGTTGLSNIILYNKFVLKDVELDKEALTITDTALNTVESETVKIGDELQVTGWNTTDYISVAGNSTMVVTSQIVEELSLLYGILYYDNTRSIIGSHLLTSSTEEVTVPGNAYYFRISTPLDDSFKIVYKISAPYDEKQLIQSNNNITDYINADLTIPEGNNEMQFTGDTLKLLVLSPLSLTKDINNVIKLSVGNIASGDSINDMFTWDKKLSAFGYDETTGTAYSYLDGEQLFTTDSEGNEIPVTTNNPEFWTYDETLSDKWIIKSTRPRISWLDNLIEYDEEKNYFKIHGNLLVTGGVTMYATDQDDTEGDDGGVGNDDPNQTPTDITELVLKLTESFVTTTEESQDVVGVKNFLNGINIGTRKIYEWKDDVIYLDSNLVVRGGITMYGNTGDVDANEWYTSLPVADPLYWDYSSGSPVLSLGDAVGSIDSINVTGDGNAITSATLSSDGKSISFTKSLKFATATELGLKADKEYVDLNFVTLKGDPQTIESQKNFIGGLLVNGNEIVYDTSTNCWKLDGNLLVSGGITMYNIDSSNISSFMLSLLLDPDTLELNDAGQLTVIGGTGGVDETLLQTLLETWGYVTKYDSLKNPYILSWSGYSSGSYDGSSAKSFIIPNNTNQLTNGAGYITEDALEPYAFASDVEDQFTAMDAIVNKKWDQNDTKISNWDTAYSWGNHANAGYSTKSYVDDTFVTIAGYDVITGKKDFTTGGLFVNGKLIVYNKSEGYWKLEGNLLVTGGITMYGDDSIDAGGSGVGVDEDAVREIIESYNYITSSDLHTFNSTDFSVSNKTVSLKTHVVTSSGTPSSYNSNTLYIIL